jgi:hypothetical protein
VLLLLLVGPRHPPTADDRVALGPVRIVLGWLTLAFIIIGFTPTPIIFPDGDAPPRQRPIERRETLVQQSMVDDIAAGHQLQLRSATAEQAKESETTSRTSIRGRRHTDVGDPDVGTPNVQDQTLAHAWNSI